MKSNIHSPGQISTPRQTKLKHTSSQSSLQETSKTYKPSSVFKSNKLISLSELLLTERSDHKSPPITPSNNQQIMIKSTNSLLNFKKVNPGSPKMINYIRQNDALKQQIAYLNAQLQRIRNEKVAPLKYQEEASLQMIKNLNLKVTVKSTLIEKIAKSLNNFREKIAYQNIQMSPQCNSEIKQLLQMINSHENSIRIQENVYYPSQQNNNRVVIVYRDNCTHPVNTENRKQQQKNWENNSYIKQLTKKLSQLQRNNIKIKEQLKKSKYTIQKQEQKLIQHGFQLHTMDMIKQKWKQAEEKLLKVKHFGQNPQKDSRVNFSRQYEDISLQNEINILKRQKQMLIEKEYTLIDRIKTQQTQRNQTINQIAQQKNNIINKLTKERNDFFTKWKQALQQVDMLKIKCTMYQRNSTNSHDMAQYNIFQEKMYSFKQTIRQYETTIQQLQQNIQLMKLNQSSHKSYGQPTKQLKDLTGKYKQLEIQRDFLLEIIKRSELNSQSNSILQKVLTEKETLSKQTRLQQIINNKSNNSIRSFSENKTNEKEFYRYKVDERYLDLKRKIHEIHQTYSHGPSAMTFFKKYTQKEEVSQNKGLILEMIRDALAILNKFEQTIIIKKSQLKKFNQNKLKYLGANIKKTKQQNIALKNDITTQLSQFKKEMEMNFSQIKGSVN